MKKGLLLFALVLGCMSMSFSQLLLVDNFDDPVYNTVGAELDTTYWKNHSGTAVATIGDGLTYAGYPGSGIGNSVQVGPAGSSDYNRTFTAQTSGNVYSFLMVNVSAATASGDYFFHYSSNPFNGGTTGIRGRLFVKGNATADSIAFGISFGSGGTVFTEMAYLVNTTYLLAFKIAVNPEASDDSVSLYVFTAPDLPTSEPAIPAISPVGLASTNDNDGGPGAIAIRQGGSNQPTLRLDGIRVTTDWSTGVLTSVGSHDARPSSYALEQNFPNPFNPSTNFRYQIGNAGFVSMKIYNVLGQEVSTPVNEYKEAGSYNTTWSAAGFNSGIYFCKLQTGLFSETKKMILIK